MSALLSERGQDAMQGDSHFHTVNAAGAACFGKFPSDYFTMLEIEPKLDLKLVFESALPSQGLPSV